MTKSLKTILFKIFVNSFYKVHAGIFLMLLLVLVAPGSPGDLINFHKSLMLFFVAKPLSLMIVFGLLLLYTFKCWHFISGKIYHVHQHFLFYSINSYSKAGQLKGWALVQASISLPVLIYMLLSMIVAVSYHYFLSAFIIFVYVTGLLLLSSFFYSRLINKLIDGSKPSFILTLTRGIKKPYFTLFVYHVFDSFKLKYLIIKVLSYFLITGVFLLFADVKTDVRVAGIAMLAIAAAHSMLILEGRRFESTFLIFANGLPISRFKLFISHLEVYSILLLPEALWLLFNLPVAPAAGLFVFCLSIILFFVSLLYLLGLDQEKYMKVVFWTFVLIFMMLLFKLLWISVWINLFVAYLIFYFNYYKFKGSPIKED